MTEHSFISSGFSGHDDNAETVSRNIKMLVVQYFLSSSKFDIEQSRAPIEALRHVSSHQRHLLRDRMGEVNELWRETTESLLKFGLRGRVSEFLNDSCMGSLASWFFDAITNLILILRIGKRMDMILELVNGIEEGATDGHVRMPLGIEASDVESDDASIRFLLCILLKLVEQVCFSDPKLLHSLWVCFRNKTDNETRVLVLQIVSHIFPSSVLVAVKMVNFIVAAMSEVNELMKARPEVDGYLKQGLTNALAFLQEDYRALVVRNIVGMLVMFRDIAQSSVVSQIFHSVQALFKLDRGFSTCCVGAFVKIFPLFAANDVFVSTCMSMAENEPDFAAALKRRYENIEINSENAMVIPALIQIVPNFLVTQTRMRSLPTDVFYHTCAIMTSLADNVSSELRARLAVDPPSPRYLHQLIKLVPREITNLLLKGTYNAAVVADVIEKAPNNISLSPHEGEFMRLSARANCPKLAALIVKRVSNYEGAAIRQDFENLIYTPCNWTDKTFCRVALRMFNCAERKKEMTDIIDLLFKENAVDALLTLSQSSEMFQEIVKISFRVFRSGKDQDAARAYNLLKRIPDQRELFDLHRYTISERIFNLARDKPERDSPTEDVLPKETRKKRAELICCLYGEDAPLAHGLTMLSKNIIPTLVAKADISILEEYERLAMMHRIGSASDSSERKSIKDMVMETIPDIFTYLFGYTEREQTKESLQFVARVCGVGVFFLCKQKLSPIALNLLLLLGHPEHVIREQTRKSIGKIVVALDSSLMSAKPSDHIKHFWLSHILSVYHEFSLILSDKKSCRKQLVINSLTKSLDYIGDELHKYYPRIVSLLDMAIKSAKLRKSCFSFWEKFISRVSHPPTIKHLFGYIVAQAIRYYGECGNGPQKVLNSLIIDKADITRECFPDVAFIPRLRERSELEGIARELKKVSLGWKDSVERMSDELPTVLPAFRTILLEQILHLLSENQTEFPRVSSIFLTQLVNKLWESTVHETVQENMILCARCMSLVIGFTENASLTGQQWIEYDEKDKIMRHLITEYLVKILVDSSSIMYHDHSAYAIQEILRLLGCRLEGPNQSPRRKSRGKTNWEQFDSDIQTLIEPFRRSRYTVNAQRKPCRFSSGSDYTPVAEKAEDDVEWLYSFISILFGIEKEVDPKGDLSMFYVCECALKDMPSLSRFILPYLVRFHVFNDNKDFLDILRKEWRYVTNLLKDTSNQRRRDFAQTVTRLFFSMFDVLSLWNISPGSEERMTSWRLLAIGSDLELSQAAKKCGLYHKALMHLEFHIRDEQRRYDSQATSYKDRMANEAAVVTKYQRKLFKLYQKLEDPDAVDFLKQNVSDQQDYDETMAAKEVLEDTGQPNYKQIEYVHELLKLGRYERARTDIWQLRSERKGRDIDRLVMNAAIRLGRWDDIREVMTDMEQNREGDIDYEMNVAKALYGISSKDEKLCKFEMEKARQALLGQFSEAAMLSYARLTPVLARFRILEELDSFMKQGDGTISRQQWPQWHLHTSLSIDEIEEITAIRFAMINVSDEAVRKKQLLSYEQFIQLSKLCRKSDAFFRAEMFCARARKYGQDNGKSSAACIYETAKIYNEKKKSNQALSLLAAAERRMAGCDQNEETKELLGKMLFSKGKWNDKWKSMDPKLIAKCYRDAAANSLDLEDMGKAFMALATLTDQRIFSLIHYLEQIKMDTAASTIRKTSSSMKFWASSSSPAVITKFLKKHLSLALNSYFEAMVKAPKTAHEIIPRVLLLCFDIGKQFVAESDVKGPFELTLGNNQKEQVLQTIRDSMKNAERVPSAVWLNSMTQLISRVEQPRKLEELLYTLIRFGVLNYPQATLWHLMSVKNSSSTERLTRFDPIWDFCKRDLPADKRDRLDNLRDKFSLVTNDLIAFCSGKKDSRMKEVKADTICPRIRENFRKSELLLPVSNSLILKSQAPEFKDPSRYDSATLTITRMENEVLQFLSLQTPRRIALVASDGNTYHYLCKEDEDLRKDMRMMEFASFVNLILSNDRRCRQRDLRLTTYAVVCLNEKCGIIEWVENTRCLRAIVEDIYTKKKIVVDRNELKRLCGPDLKGDVQTRVSNFENIILKKYPPVMHLWFARTFTDLSRWFQSRLIFTRSTAVWCIVGYFVGLGDRHAENILLREDNGCCVHVDFNCIFDRAKTLQVPENVPFRMTQNIVDGMGVLKTSGAFARTCELVTETLRAKKQKLVSVLRPFLYDPLLEWKKGGNRTAIETTAKLTLKEIESRLEGFSEDRSTINSPECTVRNLIEQATDTRNLALLFHGWQAFI